MNLFRRKKTAAGRDLLETSLPATSSARKIFPAGIKLLHSPANSADAVVDIVFVHGLTGDREKTWMAADASEPWPKALLSSKLPTARVLTFGYDASVADWRSMVSQSRIANHAWNLVTSLGTYREEDDTNKRPIIFVCHSLGGLVCKDALFTSRQRSEPHLQNIFQLTRGIAFLGTPHHGAGLARWAKLLSISIGVIKQTNSEIVSVLKSDSEVLARIQDGFHTMVQSRDKEGQPVQISCFFEELPLLGIGQVVPQDSAILPGYISIGIRANHMDMTKFATVDDPGFVAVCGELRRWTKQLGKVSTPSRNPLPPGSSNTCRGGVRRQTAQQYQPVEERLELGSPDAPPSTQQPVRRNYRRVHVTIVYWNIDGIDPLVERLSNVFRRLYFYEVATICLTPEYPIDSNFPWQDSEAINDRDLQILYYIGMTHPDPEAASRGFMDILAVSHSHPHQRLIRQDWLSDALGIPNLFSDVLIILDCYWAGLSDEGNLNISYLQGGHDWARYGVLFAGYQDETSPVGRFSEYFINVLQDLAYSVETFDTIFNCENVIAEVRRIIERSEDDAHPDWRGDTGAASFILAPIGMTHDDR